MVIVEKTPKKKESSSATLRTLTGGPSRESTKSREIQAKLRRITQGKEEGLEELASLEHDQWAGWMRHLFSKCYQGTGGSLIIPPHLVARWQRQMKTSYADLPPEEKESDRVEARKVLGLKWLEEEDHDCSGHGL